MKITFKQCLFSLMGLFFFTQSYSADMGSTEGQLKQTSESATSKQEMAAPAADVDTKAASKTQNTSLDTKLDTSPAEKSDEEMTGFSRGTVARSLFTTLVDNREPVDKVKQVPEKTGDVFYYTELRDMAGQTAKHRWEYKGKVVAEVDFKVRGPRWRVWSKKSFQPGWAGDWKVSVLNGANEVISEEMIAFTEPSQPTQDIIKNEAPEKLMDDKIQKSPEALNPPSKPALN